MLLAQTVGFGLAAVEWFTRRLHRIDLTLYPPRKIPSFKVDIPAWLERWKFDRYITLATNDPSLAGKPVPGSSIPHGLIRDRLREWDGRLNRAILGKHWAKRDSDWGIRCTADTVSSAWRTAIR